MRGDIGIKLLYSVMWVSYCYVCIPVSKLTFSAIPNPWRACPARVVVCLSVCLSVKPHSTPGASVCPETDVTYSTSNDGQNICGVLSETASLQRSSTPSVI